MVIKGEPAARCASKDENPLTSVRGRGHSSHLVCRTSGLLLLCPPPPSPSRLHDGFLFLPLQRAMDPEWRAKGWWLECFLALSFTPTLILLQCPSLLSSAHCVYPCLLFFPHTSSAIQLLPICFLINYHPHPPPPPLLHDGFFSPSSAAFPFLLLPALLLLSYLSVQAEGEDCAMQEAKSTPAAAAPERRLVIFFRQNRGSCSSHWLVSHTAAAAPDCSQRTDRKIDRQRRERERKKGREREREKREGERERALCSLFTAGCLPQLLHHAQTQLFI